MSDAVKDYLRNKDKDFSRFIPESYKITPEEKKNQTFIMLLNTKYEMMAATKCIKPCLYNFEAPSVS